MTKTTINPSDLVNLHVHSDASLLDGHTLIPDLIKRVKELGQTSVAVTDHGNLHNAFNLYKQAKAAGIKPIIGIEAYVAPSPISHKTHEPYFFSKDESQRSDDVSSRGAYTHLLLFAKNNEGLKSLYRLSELSYTEGYYRKPRMSIDLFKEHAKGNLVATTGCPSGEIQVLLRLGMYDKALEHAAMMQNIFGKENYFMEVMDHSMSIDLERKVQEDLLHISQTLNIPLIASGDSHYTNPEDASFHEHLLCISTHSKMNIPTSVEEGSAGKTRFAFDGQGYYINSAEEMLAKFPQDKYPDAIINTKRLADMCDISIEPRDDLRPAIPLPEGETEGSWVTKEAYTGLKKRLPGLCDTDEYKDRLQFELDVIVPKNYSGYFLVVSDFIRWAKNKGIPMGPGRGSAAGSLLAYCLDITDADPIRHGLLFERFLNPERESPPDVDVDVDDTRREELIAYVKDKYGSDQVAQVVTFGKILAKNAVKDTVRILDLPYSLGDQLSKAMPEPIFGKGMPLKDIYNPGSSRYDEAEDFRVLVKQENAQPVIDVALGLEGRIRSTGVHAAAVVISNKPVGGAVPMMMRQADGAMLTQWDYPTCEDLGLIKYDFLGLRNLGIIDKALKMIKRTRGLDLNYIDIVSGPMDDPKVYELLARGNTLGVFQLDGCLGGDTLVSGRKISELYESFIEGSGITSTLSVDLGAGKNVRNDVLRVVKSGVKPVYRLVSESGRMIEATADHKFMTNNGWKRLEDLTVGLDEVIVNQEVKTLYYRCCVDCGKQLAKATNLKRFSSRCYSCSAVFHSNPSKSFSREKLRAKALAGYSNGRVVWNKGLTAEEHPSLALMREKSITSLAGRNVHKERMSPVAYETFISGLSEKFRGEGNPMFGKSPSHRKGGFREDLGHYVRSTWEADYARVLKFTGVDYMYEHKTFKLKREDGSFMSYTPDFYLPATDEYVEIKGFMYPLDEDKMRLVQEQYGIKLSVIRQSEMAEFEFEFKNLIPEWECPMLPRGTEFEGIVAIELLGDQMTYDISMKSPLNNFVANGFMVHNSGMQSLLKLMKPTEFEDISAVLALYRPGPMGVGAHTDFALRKNGVQGVDFIHPELTGVLTPILADTYGLIVYQEQIQLIAREMAGYSLGQADNLRRAMGKKKREVLEAEFVPFQAGARLRGYSDESIQAIWDVMVPFADYAFNKSHTVAYGLTSYMTAFLKANFAAEFYAALLSSVSDDSDKTAAYLEDARAGGVKVFAPDVSRSEVDYVPLSSSEVLFGLRAVRGIGAAVGDEIVAERVRGGQFKDFNDFLSRVPGSIVNKRVLEGLAFGGAFDGLGVSRRALIYQIPELVKTFQKVNRSKAKQQVSLFDLDDVVDYTVFPMDEYPRMEKLSLERTALGLYVSGHPIDGLNISNMATVKIADLVSEVYPAFEGWPPRGAVPYRIAGVLTSLVVKRTKKGELFAICKIEDRSGSIECPIFPKTYKGFADLLKVDGVYQFVGFTRKRDGEVSFSVDGVRPLEFGESGNLSVRLKVTDSQWLLAKGKLLDVLSGHLPGVGEPGDDVIVSVKDVSGRVWEEVLDVKVKRSPALVQRVQELFGALCIGRWRAVQGAGGSSSAVTSEAAEVEVQAAGKPVEGAGGLF